MVNSPAPDLPVDDRDLERGLHAYIATAPLVALLAVRTGIRRFGPDNQTVVRLDTPRGPQSVAWINLKAGPIVVEVPSAVAVIHDFWSRLISGREQATRTTGMPLLALPPDFRGDPPKGYYALRSRTFGNRLVVPAPGALGRAGATPLRIYPLADAVRPPEINVIEAWGPLTQVQQHIGGLSHFSDVDRVIQEELVDAPDRDTAAMLATIGIRKGAAFAPDDRWRQILEASAAAGYHAERIIAPRIGGVGGVQ